MSDCAKERFYVWLIEKFSWFEVHMAGYVKETCFANRLMLYRSLKAKLVYYTCKWQKMQKKGYFGPFFWKFCNLCSFHCQICSRHLSGPTITGQPGVILVKTAYFTSKWLKTSKKGYFRRFFEIFQFDEISTVGSVKDTCLGIQSCGSQTVTL